LRGGSSTDSGGDARGARRLRFVPANRFQDTGFRFATGQSEPAGRVQEESLAEPTAARRRR